MKIIHDSTSGLIRYPRPLDSRCPVDTVATLKEYTNKIALTDNFSKCAECKEGNQYQQAYYAGRNQLIIPPPNSASDCAKV